MSAAEPSPLPTLASSNVITPDDHGAYVTITASLMLVSMVLLTGLRLSIRFPFTELFGLDDAAIVISAICAIAQTVTILEAVKLGLGRHIYSLADNDREITQKLIYAGNVLFIVSLSFSKTATSLMMSRLTRARNQVVAAYVTSAIIMVWGVAFTLGVAINCNATRPWDMRVGKCSNWQETWTAFGIIGLVFEVVLAVLPAYLLWGLQMSFGCKATVAFGFCFRLVMIPIEALRLYYISRTLHSSDSTFEIIPLVLLTQVEEHYSLIAATIPCLRPFLKAANTGLLDVNPTQVENCGSALAGSNGGGTGTGNSYAMRSMSDRASSTAARAASRLITNSINSKTGSRSEIATGFKAFDAHHVGVDLSSYQPSPTSPGMSSLPPHSLDAIQVIDHGAPLSASPTVARHMFVPAVSGALPVVTARAAAASPTSLTAAMTAASQADDSSFTSDGSEKMIIRKDTDLSVRYSPVVGRRPDAVETTRGVPMGMGLDLERIEEVGTQWTGSEARGESSDGGRGRAESFEVGRARGESIDVRREPPPDAQWVRMGTVQIGWRAESAPRRSSDSGTGRVGAWLEAATPAGRGSLESVQSRREDEEEERERKWHKGRWRAQRERYWSRR